MHNFCKESDGPFPACNFCNTQCQFRFEIEQLEHDSPTIGSDFRSAFTDASIQLDELARMCWDATIACFIEDDKTIRQSASYCFAAQQLDHLGLPTYSQREVGKEIYDQIIQIGGSLNG